MSAFTSQCWVPISLELVFCVMPHSLWVHILISPVVSGRLFPWRSSSFWLLQPFCLLFYIDPWALKGGVRWNIAFETECSKVPHYLHIGQCWDSLLVPIYCEKQVLWRWVNDALIPVRYITPGLIFHLHLLYIFSGFVHIIFQLEKCYFSWRSRSLASSAFSV